MANFLTYDEVSFRNFKIIIIIMGEREWAFRIFELVCVCESIFFFSKN